MIICNHITDCLQSAIYPSRLIAIYNTTFAIQNYSNSTSSAAEYWLCHKKNRSVTHDVAVASRYALYYAIKVL